MIQILKKTKLFSGFEQSSLDEFETAISLKKVKKGEIIFYEKDIAGAFYIVSQGKVKIYKASSEGKEQILMIANPGESFAEAAMFAGGIFPASAQALTDSEILCVNRDRFLGILERNPKIAINLIARLSELLHKLNRLVEELSLTDITTRLAYYLINELEKRNLSGDQPILELTEKKSVLASQLGTIPETFSRSLAKLSKEKIIEVDGSSIKILDYNKLLEISGD